MNYNKSNEKILIFDHEVSGHHLEYIHHLYVDAIEHTSQHFVFVVSEEFKIKKENYTWPQAQNVEFDYIPPNDLNNIKNKKLIANSWALCGLLLRYIKRHRPKKVFLNYLIRCVPFICFVNCYGAKIQGIIYRIYLYDYKKEGIKKKLLDILKYCCMSFAKNIDSVFILNDKSASSYLNKQFCTNKFKYLPDPFNAIEYTPKDIRMSLGINQGSKMLLHFGAMDVRKGTIDILTSIRMLDESDRSNFHFVFAGKITHSCKQRFIEAYNQIRNKDNITIIDEFCSNELIYDLCYSCDVILTPYLDVAKSSGVIAYADYFNKPLLAYDGGLVGKLIKRYKLGKLVEKGNCQKLAETYKKDLKVIGQKRYVNTHSIDNFNQVIYASFNG